MRGLECVTGSMAHTGLNAIWANHTEAVLVIRTQENELCIHNYTYSYDLFGDQGNQRLVLI